MSIGIQHDVNDGGCDCGSGCKGVVLLSVDYMGRSAMAVVEAREVSPRFGVG